MARGLHFLTLICWFAAGILAQLNWIYFLGLIVAAVLMVREHALVRGHADFNKINAAFFTLNVWISLILFFTAIGGLI